METLTMGLPPGFRFRPNDEEIINYYLRNKQNGETQPHVIDSDLYGDKEPWMIFNKELKQTFYVFTSLKNINGKRIKRSAGCGTWDTQKTDFVKNRKGQRIGFKKLLVFEVDKAHRDLAIGNGRWIMHEFSIGKDDKCVLCRIRNKDWDKKNPTAHDNNDSENIDARKRGRDDEQVLLVHDDNGLWKSFRKDENINSDANVCVSMEQGTPNHGTINEGIYLQDASNTNNVHDDDEELDWLETVLHSFKD